MEEIRLFFETTAYILCLTTLAFIIWHLSRTLTNFKVFLNSSVEAEKKQIQNLGMSIKSLKEQQSRGVPGDANPDQVEAPIHRLQDITQKLDNLYDVSNTIDRYNKLLATYNEACTQLAEKSRLEEQLAQMKQDKDNSDSALQQVQSELAESNIQKENLKRTLEESKNQTAGYEKCLPVYSVDRLYAEVAKKGNVSDADPASLHYIYSRLAVLVSIGNLKMDAEEKRVMLRDAFVDFDKAVYAQFMSNKNLLRSLRLSFEYELMPLLEGALKFRWPNPGDDLDLNEHRQELENGLGIITEVKTAILYTGAGSLMQKAVVLT